MRAVRAISPLALLAVLALLASAPVASADFGISAFDGGAFDELGEPATEAGSAPFEASTEIAFETTENSLGDLPPIYPDEGLRSLRVDLPPGLLGNPTAVPTCPYARFFDVTDSSGISNCEASTVIGTARVEVIEAGEFQTPRVFNLEPLPGQAARFGFTVVGFPVTLNATLSSEPPYHAAVEVESVFQSAPLYASEVTVWGAPADPAHDAERGGEAGIAPRPFLTLPTSCTGPVRTEALATSWEGSVDAASFLSHDNEVPPNPIGVSDCEDLEFSPALEARPTTSTADAPSGLEVELTVPQSEGPCEEGPPLLCPRATAHLKDTTVTLPEGLAINPSGANGLDACSEAEANLDSPGPARCPQASKVGTVEVETPLLDHPVKGAVYVAEPHANPFNSLLALYIALEDPASGVSVKLAGEAELDPQTGQISSTFSENPQVPFETFSLDFFGGAAGPLVTPSTCGEHETRSELRSWARPGEAVSSVEGWEITRGPGLPCARGEGSVPHLPSFEAGVLAPIAGAHSPLVLNLRRPDGSARLGAITATPPPGLVASLAATPPCPEALLAAAARREGRDEQASPSCPAASRVGTVHAQAGAGPTPYNAPGAAYLAGPYKGAPLSLAIITPALAGPFDLGVVAIRTALHVDPRTAQITAVSDPLPEILQGIPLNIRSASVRLDKPGFALNPTSCDPMAFGAQVASARGALATLASRFQLAECGRLGFKPRIALRLFGKTKRASYQGLRAVVRPRPGDANIGRTVVRMPRSAFLAQEHIRTICTRVQFAAEACPKGSVYGRAIAYTPLLSYPLEGDVYLRSSDNTLPDLVADLRGPAHQPIRVELIGRTDSVKGALRNTFDVVPDAPVSYFRLQLFGGDKGLIVNSRDICKATNRAAVRIDAQNGRRALLRPALVNRGCKKRRKGRGKDRRGARRRANPKAALARASATG